MDKKDIIKKKEFWSKKKRILGMGKEMTYLFPEIWE
jgi:hypothetical protein